MRKKQHVNFLYFKGFIFIQNQLFLCLRNGSPICPKRKSDLALVLGRLMNTDPTLGVREFFLSLSFLLLSFLCAFFRVIFKVVSSLAMCV